MSPRKGNTNCCVVGCGNKVGNTYSEVHFLRFPKDNYISAERRKKWIIAAKRINEDGSTWVPTQHSRICSSHFVGNKKSEHPSHPAYVPSVFPTHQLCSSTHNDSRFERYQRRERRKVCDKSAERQLEQVVDNTHDDIAMAMVTADIGCQTEENFAYIGASFNKTFSCCLYIKENCLKVDSAVQVTITSSTPSASQMKSVKCGPNHEETKSSKKCFFCNVDRFHGFDSLLEEIHFLDLTGVKKDVFLFLLSKLSPRKYIKISTENRLLIFLMRLKTDLTFSALGVIFSVHRTSISKIFFDTLNNLVEATKQYIYWPSKYSINATMPACFKLHYPNCRIIIDCTEIKVQQPPTLEQRIQTYSHYKGTYTAKILVGITPSGIISFLSPVYGGKTSDIQITSECGILNNLESGDVVLADKGFPGINIKDNAVIVMPPFLHNGTLTTDEVATCYNVASVRIHVERAIGRQKIFRILQNRLPTSLFPYIDDIFHIISVLVNLMNPLIKEKS